MLSVCLPLSTFEQINFHKIWYKCEEIRGIPTSYFLQSVITWMAHKFGRWE